EMVSMFNGMGGASAALISLIEFNNLMHGFSHAEVVAWSAESSLRCMLVIIMAGLVIGSVSFAGSMIAWGKLNGKIKDFAFSGQHIINLSLLSIILLVSVYLIGWLPDNTVYLFYGILVLSLLYGVLFVLPI